jgi:hypothetical protein
MPFTIRPHRRFPVCCPVTYHVGLSEGHGMVWNLSVNGWRLSGDVPPRVGQTIPLTVTLPNQQRIFVAAAIVRWRRGQEYGLETLVMAKQTQSRLEHYVTRLVQA